MVIYVVFGEEESVLFREVSIFRGVLIERFHCIYMYMDFPPVEPL